VIAKLPGDVASKFHTYAGIYDGTQLVISIDGNVAAAKPCSVTVSKNDFELAVGIDTEETARRFRGSIRRVAVYSGAMKLVNTLQEAPEAVVLLDFAKDGEKPKTQRFLAYGGDFNDRPTDYSFCSNGIVSATLTPSPQFEEVKKVYQDIHTSALDVGSPTVRIRIQNEYFFRNIGPINGSWKLMQDGAAVAEGKLTLPEVAPQQTAQLQIATGHTPKADSEYFFRVRYDLPDQNAWHPAGMPIAWDEIPLPWSKRTAPTPVASTSPASFTEDATKITLTAKDLVTVIDKSSGCITSIKAKDQEWLLTPLKLNFWRPTTNNDEGAKLDHKLKIWQYAGARAAAAKTTAVQEGNDVLVSAELAIPANQSSATVRYRFTGNGQIAVDTEFRPGKGLPTIPRIGYQCEIPNRTPVLKWYGNGPHENYIDRKSGSWTTVHEGVIPSLFHRYIDPQESGNRTGIRWATLSSPMGGASVRIDATGDSLLETSCYPCSAADIQLAMHSSEIPQRNFYTLNLDHRQSGLGGTDSWGALALPQYLIRPDRTYQWSFLLSPSETPVVQPTALPPGLPRELPKK
jgi:beta-galactosidase